MRDPPEGAALLRQARALLLEDLIEALPAERRYQARLVANAMAIAERELDAGVGPLEAESRALAELLGESSTPGGHAVEALEETLLRLNWWLAAEIRGARRDGEARLYALLRATAIARLRESNPKALDEAGLSWRRRDRLTTAGHTRR